MPSRRTTLNTNSVIGKDAIVAVPDGLGAAEEFPEVVESAAGDRLGAKYRRNAPSAAFFGHACRSEFQALPQLVSADVDIGRPPSDLAGVETSR